jgi:hypothetical protein
MPAKRLQQHVENWTAAEKDELRPQLIAEKKRLRELATAPKNTTGVRNASE